jgi:hypothetical protein
VKWYENSNESNKTKSRRESRTKREREKKKAECDDREKSRALACVKEVQRVRGTEQTIVGRQDEDDVILQVTIFVILSPFSLYFG